MTNIEDEFNENKNGSGVDVGFNEEEYLTMEEEEEGDISDLQATIEFIGRYDVAYQATNNQEGYPEYKPRQHSVYRLMRKQNGYTVHYSCPKDSKTVVASFWTQYIDEKGQTRFSLQHIDFARLMYPILELNKSRGFLPPTPKEATGKDDSENLF